MAGEERRVLETEARYRTGEAGEWRHCQLVLSSERLVLATGEDTTTIPHGRGRLVEDGSGLTLDVGETRLHLRADDAELAPTYARAVLDGTVVLGKAPAVVGGVVQDASWEKVRLRIGTDAVTLEFVDDDARTIAFAAVSGVDTATSEVEGTRRDVVVIEHAADGDRAVETHLSGAEHHVPAIRTLFDPGDEAADVELTETERQVLMALYSGVSPLEMSAFVGIDVDEVEEIYQRLREMGAVDAVRTRTEVELTAQGRNLASESMSEE